MSRNPDLEALLQALYDLEMCARIQRDACRVRFEELLDQAIARGAVPRLSKPQIEEALAEPYREFRRAKRLEERPSFRGFVSRVPPANARHD
jgi:hypothetical protein